MRILHISASGLPDGRIERMAVLDKLLGHDTFYAGPHINGFCIDPVFDGCYVLPQTVLTWLGEPFAYRKYRLNTERIIRKVNPDIVHVHNIYSVMPVLDSGYPFILNDHEFLSMQVRLDNRKRRTSIAYHKILRYIQLVLWPKREHILAQNAPVVTVSEPIADHYKNLGADSFVVPNYPTRFELSNAVFSKKSESLVIASLGGTLDDTVTYRNSAGLIEFFNKLARPLKCIGRTEYKSSEWVEFMGFIPHMDIFTELSKCHIGIVPWKKHLYHKVCSLNKVYTYAHCGLVVVVTPYLDEVIKSFRGRCRVVDRYEDLEWVLQDLDDNMDATIAEGERNKEFALKNFILENYKGIIEEAYRNA